MVVVVVVMKDWEEETMEEAEAEGGESMLDNSPWMTLA